MGGGGTSSAVPARGSSAARPGVHIATGRCQRTADALRRALSNWAKSKHPRRIAPTGQWHVACVLTARERYSCAESAPSPTCGADAEQEGTEVRSWGMLLGAAILVLMTTGCDRTNERSRNVVEIVSVAENGVFIAGIIDPGADQDACTAADNEIPPGHVQIVLKNRPYNSFVTAEDYAPYGQFHVTGVSVEWVDVSTSDPAEALNAFNELSVYNYSTGYDVAVPINTEVAFNVMVVPLHLKSADYFQGLLPACLRGALAPTLPFSATAQITLVGHDSGSEDEVTVQGYTIIEFIGVVDSD